MAALLPPPPVNPTGQLAQTMPGYDPGPVIAAHEQSLQDYLNLPVREILDRLGLPPFADPKQDRGALPPEAQPNDAQPQASPMDPSALISPVTDALGTLGSGLFDGVDPTTMLQGISQAFQSTGAPLKQSLASVDDAWQGASGTKAAAKTTEAIANGSEVGAQSDALKGSLTTAATNVGQARMRVIEIIAEFQATLAAIGPNIIFPWGWAAAIAAANKAVASTAEVMTELQSSLGAQAAQVTEAGSPVSITAAPQLASASPMGSMAPLMSMAMKGAEAGIQAGTGAASAASQAAQQAATDPAVDAAGAAAGGPVPAGVGAGAGVGGGGVGGGGGAALAPRSIASSAMVQPETSSATAQSAVRAASVGAFGGSGGMMGGGAPYGPMAGQGANNSSNSHTAAAFLHTSDQGGEIVGDLGSAAPPVLGEADPNESPDVELRI
jgi:hypothetical protein